MNILTKNRIRTLGFGMLVVAAVFFIAAFVAWGKVQSGYKALGHFSDAQNVTLSYNDNGQLVDRGTVEGAQAIRSLLEDDWGFDIVESDLDPNDPVVNTATEYMYQMATIGYHTLHSTQTVTLDEDVEYNGTLYPAGTYDVEVDGKYWTDFDRNDPLEGPAREMAWSGTVHGLFAELGVGTTTHATLQLALGVTALFGGMGLTMLILGLGLIWVGGEKKEAAIVSASEKTLETV